MKANIGKYVNWWGPYQIASALCFWVPYKKDEYGCKEKPQWVHDFGEFIAHGFHKVPEDQKSLCWSRQDRPKTFGIVAVFALLDLLGIKFNESLRAINDPSCLQTQEVRVA